MLLCVQDTPPPGLRVVVTGSVSMALQVMEHVCVTLFGDWRTAAKSARTAAVVMECAAMEQRELQRAPVTLVMRLPIAWSALPIGRVPAVKSPAPSMQTKKFVICTAAVNTIAPLLMGRRTVLRQS